MDALKNKTATQKRARVESSDDEEAILALLDEIDSIQPPVVKGEGNVPVVKDEENVQNTRDMMDMMDMLDVKKNVSRLSSEIDFMQDDGPTIGGIPRELAPKSTFVLSEPTLKPTFVLSEPTLKPTFEPAPKPTPDPTPDPKTKTKTKPTLNTTLASAATSVPLHVHDFNDDLLQFLPYPFFPENFAVSDWTRNAHSISSKTKDINWEKLSSISVAKTLKSGAKCPLMLLMVREVSVNARDLGVTLLDESGTISATIHEKVLSTHKIRVHFGLSLLVRDATVFCLTEQTDRHLIVTPNNLVKIYSNVHHV